MMIIINMYELKRIRGKAKKEQKVQQGRYSDTLNEQAWSMNEFGIACWTQAGDNIASSYPLGWPIIE